MRTSLDEITGMSGPSSTCLCGCGQAIDMSKSRGKPRLHFSDTCRKRYYRQIQKLNRHVTINSISVEAQ